MPLSSSATTALLICVQAFGEIPVCHPERLRKPRPSVRSALFPAYTPGRPCICIQVVSLSFVRSRRLRFPTASWIEKRAARQTDASLQNRTDNNRHLTQKVRLYDVSRMGRYGET